MSAKSNIALNISARQVFELVQKLPSGDKKRLISILEREQYINNIPEADKEIVRARVKKYTTNPRQLVTEAKALKQINLM